VSARPEQSGGAAAQFQRAVSAPAGARRGAPFRDHLPPQAAGQADALLRSRPHPRRGRGAQARAAARLRQRETHRSGDRRGAAQGAVDERARGAGDHRSAARLARLSRAMAPSDEIDRALHPSAWLIVPTLALLAGQGFAATPWALPFAAGAVFVLGYARHRELLFPQFPENHLRAVMARDERLYLEGTLRHEPEKLIHRSR